MEDCPYPLHAFTSLQGLSCEMSLLRIAPGEMLACYSLWSVNVNDRVNCLREEVHSYQIFTSL